MHEDQDRETLLEQLQWTRRVAAGMVESAGIADDVVQETWLRVLEHPPRDPSRRRGWLARIARNAARQHWRRARRRDDVEHVRAVEAEPASEATVELVAGMVPVNLIHEIHRVGFDYGMTAREVADGVLAGHRVLHVSTIELGVRGER